MDAYASASVTATHFGVSRQYLSRLCTEGRIPSTREESTGGGPPRLMMSHLDVARVLLETGGLAVHECACWQGGYQVGKDDLSQQLEDLDLECKTLRTALASIRAELADVLKPVVQDTAPPETPSAAVLPPRTSSPPAPPVPPTSLEPTPEEREAAYEKELGQVIGINHRPLTGEEKQQARTLRAKQWERQRPNAGGPGRRGGLFGFRKG